MMTCVVGFPHLLFPVSSLKRTLCFLPLSLPQAARSCVPPAATEPSASCAAPARTGEFVTTSLGSAPALLDGWWVLLILVYSLELDVNCSLF